VVGVLGSAVTFRRKMEDVRIFGMTVTVFVLGLFIGTNLGVLLMCLMRMASPKGAGNGSDCKE